MLGSLSVRYIGGEHAVAEGDDLVIAYIFLQLLKRLVLVNLYSRDNLALRFDIDYFCSHVFFPFPNDG